MLLEELEWIVNLMLPSRQNLDYEENEYHY